jgi:rRNA maturation protein Rpf1
MLESLLDFGQVKFNGQGTEILTFPKKVVKNLKKELDHKVFMKIERHLNLYAIMSSDGELITTGYRTKRLKGH